MSDRPAYDGHVSADGPAAHRSLGEITLHKLGVGGFGNNCYLLVDEATHDALLVDAAADWPRIAELVRETGSQVRGIVTTHRHHDHVGALAEAVQQTGATTYAGRDDADHLPVPTEVPLDHGDTIAVGDHPIDVVALRGHTPGSVALVLTDNDDARHVISGDSLFPGGVGATNHYDYQSFPQLYADVVARLFDVYDDAHVYPGHGDDTTLAAERPHLEEWKERGW